jgi:transcription antitermination protein NusB
MTTSLPFQKSREVIFLLLFSEDLNSNDPQKLCEFLMDELKISRSKIKEAYEKAKAILSVLPEIDRVITDISTSYSIDRLQRVDCTILRLAVFELLIEKVIPQQIIIAEAKRLAKKFSTPDSVAFCQALLDALVKKQPSI